jgi:lipoprotein-anchoring transpeptidase ErfK/SrfK
LAADSVIEAKIQNDAVTTDKILDSAITLAKIQDISTSKVIGRTTAGTGVPEQVSILDEDDMTSNSNTSIATQQSIKAYIDNSISGLPTFYAFSSGSITTEAQHTISYPSAWTGGTPDKILVSTRYPTGDALSTVFFQLVTFDSTSVTVFAQAGATSFASHFCDILLVKN